MIDQLISRAWENPLFHEQRGLLSAGWLQRQLNIDERVSISEQTIVQCTQAAAILAASANPAHQRAAFSAAAYAADLGRERLPGLDGVLRIVLTQMGNFPALESAAVVGAFLRLPTQVAVSEELRREQNRVQVGGRSIELTDFQRLLWDVLARGDNVAISAPTSAGKSFVLQTYLRAQVSTGRLKAACYLVRVAL